MPSTPDLGRAGDAGASGGRRRLVAAFGGAVGVSVVLGMVPWGQMALFPLALLATWAHEMGHGIGGLVTGNTFHELELYPDLGGQALIGGADGWSQVVVSSLGLVGPALLGAIVMIAGARPKVAPHVLTGLAVAVLASTALWVRNLFGFVAMALLGMALAAAARFLPPMARVVLTQIIAVQLALAAWSRRDYLFVEGFDRDGEFYASDTQRIADEWLLPHWFWGALLGGASVAIVVGAFRIAWLGSGPAPDDEVESPLRLSE